MPAEITPCFAGMTRIWILQEVQGCAHRKVSEKYHISVDNIYYYINYGLLVPPKPRGQYVFDEQTVRDLEWILGLKELDFSLREIPRYPVPETHLRISKLPQDMEELERNLQGKTRLLQERNRAQTADIGTFGLHIKAMEARENVPQHRYRCPSFGPAAFALFLSAAKSPFLCLRWKWTSALFTKGTYPAPAVTALISPQASLMTPNKNENLQDTPDITRELYKDLPPALISTFQRSYNWMLKQIQETGAAQKK